MVGWHSSGPQTAQRSFAYDGKGRMVAAWDGPAFSVYGYASRTVGRAGSTWLVIDTTTDADGGQTFTVKTFASADEVLSSIKGWYGGQGLTSDRFALFGTVIGVNTTKERKPVPLDALAE